MILNTNDTWPNIWPFDVHFITFWFIYYIIYLFLLRAENTLSTAEASGDRIEPAGVDADEVLERGKIASTYIGVATEGTSQNQAIDILITIAVLFMLIIFYLSYLCLTSYALLPVQC